MGFWHDFKREYRRQKAERTGPAAARPAGYRTFAADDDRLAAVGESHYQPALRAACDGCEDVPLRVECRAVFIAEPDNQFDPHAIRVEVRGRKVGYFSRDDAREHTQVMGRLAILGYEGGECEALIAGREGIDRGLGIWLCIPHPDLMLEELEEERL